MGEDFVIDLLPTRGLDQSILLAVLLGMWIMLYFTETLGWVFVGVVVPGYLASVAIIQPQTAIAICIEAVVTLALSRWITYGLGKTGAWTEFFGRDRFFLILLISVIVRQIDQTWLLPSLAYWIAPGQTDHWLGQDFFSIGLVVVPLAANMMWKLSVRASLIQIGLIFVITALFLRWVLLSHTNLSFSNFELTYENTAIDFVANAKAYIVMLTTAYVAGIVNLRYGWNFGGILVAALLALLWLTPTKLALTVLEAVVLYHIMKSLLRLPLLSTLNLEGSRKVCAVFSLAFFLKWCIGFAIGDHFPGLKVTDLFAFGYLMSSLLAVRMLQEKCVRIVLMPALLTSLIGFVFGSIFGFSLEQLANGITSPRRTDSQLMASQRLLRTPEGAMAFAASRRAHNLGQAYGDRWLVRAQRRMAFAALAPWVDRGRAKMPPSLRQSLAGAELLVTPLAQGFAHGEQSYLIHPGENIEARARPGDMALVVAGAPGPVLVLPHLGNDLALAEFAARACRRTRCAAIVVKTRIDRGPRARSVTEPRDLAQPIDTMIESLLRYRTVIQLHRSDELTPETAVLHPAGPLRDTVTFARLWPERVHIDWRRPPALAEDDEPFVGDWYLRVAPPEFGESVQLGAGGQRTSMVVEHESVRDMFSELPDQPFVALPGEDSGDALLPTTSHRVSHEDVTQQLSVAELRYLQSAIIEPLLHEARSGHVRERLLETLAHRAARIDHFVGWIDQCDATHACVSISSDETTMSGGALLVLRVGRAANIDIEVPRPLRERGSREAAYALWSSLDARALLIARPNPARFDLEIGPRSAFHAFHLGLDAPFESLPADGEPVFVEIRGFADSPGIAAELIIGVGRPFIDKRQLPPAIDRVVGANSVLDWVGQPEFSDGSPLLHGYSGAGDTRVEHARALGRRPLVTLWYAAELRRSYTFPARRDDSIWHPVTGPMARHPELWSPPGHARARTREGDDDGTHGFWAWSWLRGANTDQAEHCPPPPPTTSKFESESEQALERVEDSEFHEAVGALNKAISWASTFAATRNPHYLAKLADFVATHPMTTAGMAVDQLSGQRYLWIEHRGWASWERGLINLENVRDSHWTGVGRASLPEDGDLFFLPRHRSYHIRLNCAARALASKGRTRSAAP